MFKIKFSEQTDDAYRWQACQGAQCFYIDILKFDFYRWCSHRFFLLNWFNYADELESHLPNLLNQLLENKTLCTNLGPENPLIIGGFRPGDDGNKKELIVQYAIGPWHKVGRGTLFEETVSLLYVAEKKANAPQVNGYHRPNGIL